MTGEWQPIETAPKDGTAILVADAKSVEVGVWQEATEDETDCGVVIMPGFDEGWWGSEWQPGASQPTHWMPLPEPPALGVDQDRTRMCANELEAAMRADAVAVPFVRMAHAILGNLSLPLADRVDAAYAVLDKLLKEATDAR